MTETKTTEPKPSKTQIARHLIMGVRTVRRLIEEGKLPASGTLDDYREAHIRHLREQAAGRAAKSGDADLVTERALLAKRQRERVEYQLSIMRHEHVRVDEVSRQYDARVSVLKEHFIVFGAMVSPYLVNIPTAGQARQIIDEHLFKRMDEYADGVNLDVEDLRAGIEPGPEQKKETSK